MKHTLALIFAAATLTCLACQSGDPIAGINSDPSAEGVADQVGPVAGPNLYDFAIGVLEQAASSGYPQLRANAIEGLEVRTDLLEPYARNGLVDENRGVRFVSAMTIGRKHLTNLVALVEPLLHDDSESVRAAAIFALRQCGRKVDLNPLGAMMRSPDPEVRANAAMVLGELGDSTAAPMIEQYLGRGQELTSPARGKIVDLQLAEALVKLGRPQQVDSIRAALFYPVEQQGEITALACMILGRIGDGGAIGGLQALVEADGPQRRPAEIRMAAAVGLAMLGRTVSVQIAGEYANNHLEALRYQAASTLGYIGGRESIDLLQRLLNDGSPLVRVAAAAAIVRI